MRGEFHFKVPREYRKNLEFRKWLLDECSKSALMRDAVWRACRKDLLFYINTFCYQYNPLIKGIHSVGPFITWKFQEDALMSQPPAKKGIVWCYENDRTAVVEKSRDMGASWLFLIFEDYLCKFHDHVQAFNISRSADAVDSATKNSLFEKIRFINRHQPNWLTGQIDDQKFHFDYDRTKSEIAGEASTGRAGTGGRASVIFVDEFSEIKEDTKVRQNTASIAECRFFNGTHLGIQTEFYRMTKEKEFVQIQMHWTRHPRKNTHLYSWDLNLGRVQYWKYDDVWDDLVPVDKPVNKFPEDYPFDRSGAPSGGPHPGIRSVWYDNKAAAIGTVRQVAMELDINPSGSSSQFYDALTISRLMSVSETPDWSGDLDLDTDTCRPFQLVPKEKDALLSLWLKPGLDQHGRLCHVPPSEYVVAGDISNGVGATPTCLTIFDCMRGKKVGRYRSIWKDPKDMARIAVALCRLFKTPLGESAYLIWEGQGPGLVFGNEVVKDIGFTNIYWRKEIFDTEERDTATPGWNASPNSRLQLHTDYHNALRGGQFINPDKDALEETLAYSFQPDGTVGHPRAKRSNDNAAAGANHGDLVVADALAWLVAKKKDVPNRIIEKPVPIAVPNSIQGRREYNRLREKKPMWA